MVRGRTGIAVCRSSRSGRRRVPDGHGDGDVLGWYRSEQITITGTNDVPVISGELSGSVIEDEVFAASGQLDISDDDAGEAFFEAATISGAHGSLTIDASGAWTYEVDNDQAAVQSLGVGAH